MFIILNTDITSLRVTNGSVAIHLLVIACLSAITLNVFFETAHLYRRSIFSFARLSVRTCLKLLFYFFTKNKTITSPATPEAKQKYEGIPKGRYNLARQVLCLFLACSRKMVAKTLGFVK
jgi:pyruvate dehydrogenase complex dehydrogenase (E1) component